MMKRTLIFRLVVHPSHAVHFQRSTSDADANVKKRYTERWLGASADYIGMEPAKSEWIPYFLSEGTAKAVFSARVEYRKDRETIYENIPPFNVDQRFYKHSSQVYAGYRKDTKHIRVLEGEHIPALMKPLREVDMGSADDVNVFELSVPTLKLTIKDRMKAELEKQANRWVKEIHPHAAHQTIYLQTFELKLDAVTPVFLPAHTVKCSYDDLKFKIICCGVRGIVQGPFLPNPEAFARLSFITSWLATSSFLTKVMLYPLPSSAVAGSFVSFAVYYTVFYIARQYPRWKLEYRKKMQVRTQAERVEEDTKGFKPKADPSNMDTFFDEKTRVTHEARTKQQRTEERSSSSSSSEGSSSGATPRSTFHDPKGYYAVLKLRGSEDLEQVRAAFRKQTLTHHPDHGGSGKTQKKLNEAYSVLRDKRKRAAYDAGKLM